MLAAMPDSAPSPLSAGGASPRDGGAARATPRAGGDACPGTLRLHRADDGALARVRIPGGVLSADRAEALLTAAARFGDGELHLTSRGNVQLRGLGTECGGELAGLLTAAGLLPSAAHERARNIVASPLAGLDGSGGLGAWLTELDRLVCGSPAAATLSGRFLFALDDGRGDVDALGADVTLIAEGPVGAGAALLRIGAVDEVFRVPAAEAPRAALRAAEEFLRAARDSGAWRVKDLPDDVRAELVTTIGSASGPAVARPRPRTATPPTPGPHGSAITADVPLGRLTPTQWQLLTDTARRYGGELRLTPWRGIVIPGPVPRPEASEALRTLSEAGLITAPDSPWTGVGACIGHPGCAKSLSDVRAEAGAAVGVPGRLPVYWSGCERRCGHPHGEWIDVVVTPDGHRISHVRGERRAPLATATTTVRNDPARLAAAVAEART
ncbi:cobalamin biosynthesis protein CobG [Streptomyces sp. SID5594]|uniref:nitrite/sulfite reductase n=1 Tax=unclassified Streptomyces TaxID=2593676 RepID=UPI000382B529|nr:MULTISPECIES: nitrite/sulfite reductase [unclassified Streptomyces]MZF56745.1 cobalamin biosynthesis protein CobG [Streptomyces sp. SID5594]